MPTQKEIKHAILERLSDKSERLGFRHKVLKSDFDLIRSGMLDSMNFIQFVVEMEEHFSIQIDFEKEDPRTFTTLNGLSDLILRTISKQ